MGKVCPGGGYIQWGIPYHVIYPMMHVMLPTPLSPCGQNDWQTDTCENITLSPLRLRAVTLGSASNESGKNEQIFTVRQRRDKANVLRRVCPSFCLPKRGRRVVPM